jgi:hypothetical protein
VSKRLSEAKAWREIGNRLLAPDYAPRYGAGQLCLEAARLTAEKRISPPVSEQMQDRAMAHVLARHRRCVAYLAEEEMTLGEMREARALAAYWMALEAEEEGK